MMNQHYCKELSCIVDKEEDCKQHNLSINAIKIFNSSETLPVRKQEYSDILNVIEFFSGYKDKLKIKTLIEQAMQENQFFLNYQPQVDIKSGNIIGLEALIRWKHPDMGLICPNDFIPCAEETGLICDIGEWVLKKACNQAKHWQNIGLKPMKISVNLSTEQFFKSNLLDIVSNALKESNLDPMYLELEITESMAMNAEDAIYTLNELRKLGVKISVDDFGTGYSSLNYLRKFPINYLKIDKSFIKDLEIDNTDMIIVNAIIDMAHKLGLQVIAEGVENKEQLKFLQLNNCEFVQGFYFEKPLSSEYIEENFDILQGSIKCKN